MSADIINLTLTSIVNNQVNGLTVICYMKPVPHIFTLAVYRKLFICQGTADNQRDQLFREMIGPVVIRAA